MKKGTLIILLVVLALLPLWIVCFCDNSPWQKGMTAENTFFTSYSSPVKGLDPATSYYVHESSVLDNVVEAPLDYDYTARPYKLIPRILTQIPEPEYFDEKGNPLQGDPAPESVHRVEYRLALLEGLQYQPHPCFVRHDDGTSAYTGVAPLAVPADCQSPMDFPALDSRPVRAEDLKVALIRLCDPRLASPVYANFSSFIAGMKECSEEIQDRLAQSDARIDYRTVPFQGMEILSDRECKLVLSRKYPQALYWLALHFFAPVPWEALEFYEIPAVAQTGLCFRNWPVGSGAFLLEGMDPNVQISLKKNPNFRKMYWAGAPNRPLPLLDRVVFQYEREGIPNWIKFNQGYYDTSGIPSDMLDVATSFNPNGDLGLSPAMEAQGMTMQRSIAPTIFYFGFNMLDPVVGGTSEQQRSLRQAISIVLDYQEFIDIFLNGQGVPAQCVIPRGITGARRDNPFVSPWDESKGKPVALSIEHARQLMAQAGYPNGISPDGSPLTLFLDHANAGSSAFKAQFQWLKNKFALLGIQIEERPSELNRWRDKLETGNWQLIFNKGWLADYPDPENFLFLFYSKNGTVLSKGRGANYSNYASAEFDAVFQQLETMENGPAREKLIEQACAIIQRDAPCCWGYHPAKVILSHQWLANYIPHDMSYNTMQYLDIDQALRQKCLDLWNSPRRWPLYVWLAIICTGGFFVLRAKGPRDTKHKKIAHRVHGTPKVTTALPLGNTLEFKQNDLSILDSTCYQTTHPVE